MLESIHISNYALIDSIDIEFNQGFNIITGETGAGKSIILGALGLLLGGRADNHTIGHSDNKSLIEAKFTVSNNGLLYDYCTANEIEWIDNQMILRRELSPNGRSRAFINDSPVTLADMKQVGRMLIDIHSQHQNQLLSEPWFQMRIIDTIADNNTLLEEYRQLYSDFQAAMRNFRATKKSIARDRENADFMEFQLQQLDKVAPKDGELQSLEEELEVITSQSELNTHVSTAIATLSENPTSILSQLIRLQESCSELESLLPENDRIIERLDNISIELNDISTTLSNLNSKSSSASQSDIEFIENRINNIRTLMHKHSVDTEAELISIQSNLRQRINALNDSEIIIADLEKEARIAHKRALDAAKVISARRNKAAEEFAAHLTETAMPLGMKNLQCQINIKKIDLCNVGIDDVEFLFAFNKSQTPIPISGAASGGEISRLMLSVKSIIASFYDLPTIIFDEVDTGVSGDVASRMGMMMSEMSTNMQVITITHLPQVAAKGNTHFKVFKEDSDTSTHTNIILLTNAQRIDELALMLSGDPNNVAARANAESLLSNNITH